MGARGGHCNAVLCLGMFISLLKFGRVYWVGWRSCWDLLSFESVFFAN